MPTYEHIGNCCGYEWEDSYSIKQDPPTVCPNCGVEGQVERLISFGHGGFIISLKGHDLKQKIFSEAMAARKRAATDENFRANILGEDKYQAQVSQREAIEKDLIGIGKDASKIKSTDVKSSKPSKIKRVDS